MKTKITLLTTIAVLTMASSFSAQAVQVYDLKTDWSDTQNPNGTWEYRVYFYYPGDLSGNNSFVLDELLSDDPYPWFREEIAFGTNQINTIARTTEAEAVSGFLEVGDIYAISTGVYAYQSEVRWIAPADGIIDVDGAAWSFDTWNSGRWQLLFNGTVLSSGYTSGTRSEPEEFSTGELVPDALLQIPVQAGDPLDLRMNSWAGGGVPFGINLTVTFTPDVLDPPEELQNLLQMVLEFGLENGTIDGMGSLLNLAIDIIEDLEVNNDEAAYRSLDAFIRIVIVDSHSRRFLLTPDQAAQLVAAAREIQAQLLLP